MFRVRPVGLGLTLGCVGLVCVGVWFLGSRFLDYEYTVATLDCGRGRRIVLTTWSLHEGAADLSYQVRVDGRVVVPPSHTDARGYYFWEGQGRIDRLDFDRLHFDTVASADGQLVGVVAREFPYTVLAVHDFATGESWPHLLREYGTTGTSSRGSLHDGLRRMQAVRERLEAEHPRLSPAAKAGDAAYLAGREDIDLSYSRAGDAEVARVAVSPSLRTIRLEGSLVTTAGLHALSANPGLRTVFVSHTALTDEGLAALATAPGLEQLTASDTGVTNRGLVHLRAARKLWSVNLDRTAVTRGGVADLRKLRPDLHVWWRDY